MRIETDRLILRDWAPGDGAAFQRHTNTPAVMRWLGGVKSATEMDETIARLTGWQEERGFTFWAVERRADGELLGFCGLKLADGEGSTVAGVHEAGWRLREDVWGHGYAKEAATATLDHAFDVLDTPRVVALTIVENSASWGLMERLGMARRADLDYHDPRWGDLNPTIVYEIEARQWRA